jgi:hypothetical protein
MKRIVLQLDEDTYRVLRLRAYEERKCVSVVAGEAVRNGLALAKPDGTDIRSKFSFIGSGASGRGDISVNHDEALAEDLK